MIIKQISDTKRFVEHEHHVDIEEKVIGIWAVTQCNMPKNNLPSNAITFTTAKIIYFKAKKNKPVYLKKEERKLKSKDFRQKNKLKGYKLTAIEYESMREKQKDKCAICGSKQPLHYNDGELCIDHDHASGKVRGLLCTRCNSGLGFFKDNKEFLTNAISYLENSL